MFCGTDGCTYVTLYMHVHVRLLVGRWMDRWMGGQMGGCMCLCICTYTYAKVVYVRILMGIAYRTSMLCMFVLRLRYYVVSIL